MLVAAVAAAARGVSAGTLPLAHIHFEFQLAAYSPPLVSVMMGRPVLTTLAHSLASLAATQPARPLGLAALVAQGLRRLAEHLRVGPPLGQAVERAAAA